MHVPLFVRLSEFVFVYYCAQAMPSPTKTIGERMSESSNSRHKEEEPRVIRPCFSESCSHWKDTDGRRIEAHGAGIIQSPTDKRWYWYGEGEKTDTLEDHGINCYSSDSLAGPWHFEGEVFSQQDLKIQESSGPFVVERPKVIFNVEAQKFVMWFHADDSDYKFRSVGVATADLPTGPFTFVHVLQPDGESSLDMSLYVDYDGVAYFIRSVGNTHFAISSLTGDFLNTTGILSIGSGLISSDQPCLEGFAMFRHPYSRHGTLYMMTSHCNYWEPTPLSLLRSDGPNMSDPQWFDLGNPTGEDKSFNSQPNFVVTYESDTGESYPIYMADNWIYAGKEGLHDASYVWLPLHFDDNGMPSLQQLEQWTMDKPFEALTVDHSCKHKYFFHRIFCDLLLSVRRRVQ